MKKEKKVRAYQRRTKSGKTVTVRAHTASYEAAEKAMEAAKKKGAGDEIAERKKKNWELPMDEFLKKLKEERAQKREDEEPKNVEDEKPKKSEKKTEKKTSSKKRTVGTGTNGPEPKKKTTIKKTSTKEDASEPAFTRDEFKEWYRGTGSAADKKVAKALRKQLGRSGYRKFEDEAIDNYTSRGHLSMFKRVSGGSSTSVKTKSADATKSDKNKKEPISEKSLNSKGFKTFKMPQIGTLYLGKVGKGAYIKFKGKKTIQKADIDDYEDFITGHDGLTKSQRKQLSSLGYTEHEEYTSRGKSYKKRSVGTGTNGPESKRKSWERESGKLMTERMRLDMEGKGMLKPLHKKSDYKDPVGEGVKRKNPKPIVKRRKSEPTNMKKELSSLITGLKGSTMRTYQKPAKFTSRKDGTIETSVYGVSMAENLHKKGWKNVDKVTVVGGTKNYVSPDGKYHAMVSRNKTKIRPIKKGEKVEGHSWDSIFNV